jgi:hypothetical protein
MVCFPHEPALLLRTVQLQPPVISQIVPTNPAAPVKGPTHVVKRGKTPEAQRGVCEAVWRDCPSISSNSSQAG